MQAYSPDLRQRVLADCDRGLSTRVVATKYSVSESWVRRLKQRRRQSGETAPRLPGPRRPPQLDAYRERLQEMVAAHPDATLRSVGLLKRGVSTLAVAVKFCRRSTVQLPLSYAGLFGWL